MFWFCKFIEYNKKVMFTLLYIALFFLVYYFMITVKFAKEKLLLRSEFYLFFACFYASEPVIAVPRGIVYLSCTFIFLVKALSQECHYVDSPDSHSVLMS